MARVQRGSLACPRMQLHCTFCPRVVGRRSVAGVHGNHHHHLVRSSRACRSGCAGRASYLQPQEHLHRGSHSCTRRHRRPGHVVRQMQQHVESRHLVAPGHLLPRPLSEPSEAVLPCSSLGRGGRLGPGVCCSVRRSTAALCATGCVCCAGLSCLLSQWLSLAVAM